MKPRLIEHVPLEGNLWVRNSHKKRGWRVRITGVTALHVYFTWCEAGHKPDYYGREFFLRAFDPVPSEVE